MYLINSAPRHEDVWVSEGIPTKLLVFIYYNELQLIEKNGTK
jgi:hypothetical protein